jgi:hypothetical protein
VHQLTVAIPEQWAAPEQITVDASGPDPVTSDIQVLAQDVTLQGQIGGAALDATTLQRVDVQLWAYDRNAGLNYKRDGAHYSLKVGPVLRSPSDVDRFQGNLVGTISADDRGQIAGAVDGTTAALFPPPIVLEDTVYSFKAVQHVDAAFKVAQPAGALDLPPFNTVITIGPDGESTVTMQEGDSDAP